MSDFQYSYNIYFSVLYSDGTEISKEEYNQPREDPLDMYGMRKPICFDVEYWLYENIKDFLEFEGLIFSNILLRVEENEFLGFLNCDVDLSESLSKLNGKIYEYTDYTIRIDQISSEIPTVKGCDDKF